MSSAGTLDLLFLATLTVPTWRTQQAPSYFHPAEFQAGWHPYTC